MRYNYVSAAIVASACVVAAAPAQIFGRSAFTVNQVDTGRKVLRSGPQAMLKTYNKFAHVGAVAPEHVVKAAALSGQQGSADATPQQYDSEYLVPVTAGASTLNLDFDTGSADLWVFSNLLPSNEQNGHNLYQPSSSAEEEQGETWNISYGDGSGASGVVYADSVEVGPVTATSQAVEAATSVSSEFVNGPGDGLLGLAFSSINTVTPNQATTFFDTVKSTLSQPLFTADLKHQATGSYGFGYIDSSLYTGDITYNAVDNSQGFWGFTAGGYSVGSGASTSGSIGSAIADTGTTLLYVPDAVVSAYYNQVSGSSNSQSDGGYIFSCDASLPDFNVEIGGATYTVPGSYINYAPANENGQCFGGIQSSDGIGFNIFGDIFLKSVFVVFSETSGSPQIGFAAQS